MMLSALRFFFVVARPGDDAVLIGAAVVGFALYLAVLNPTGFEQTLDLAIVFQLFAASTGYRERLRRGHFDPILVGRAGSWRIAAAHWAVSASVGVLVWIVLVLIELTIRPGQWPMGLKAPHLLVLLYTSTAVWALALPLPRYTGALLWLVALVALLATQKLQALRLTFTPVPETLAQTLRATGSVFVLPFLLLIDPEVASVKLLAATLLGTVLVWMLGALIIRQFDGALVEDR